MQYLARALLVAMSCWLLGSLSGGCTGASTSSVLGPLTLTQPTRELPLFGHDEGGLSLSHLQFKGSHNSYHQAPRFPLWPTWRYTHAPIEVQLSQQGVRQLELDVRYDEGEILIGHLPMVDGRTTCRTLTTCLHQLKRWSKRHPGHLPVFVFIEPKERVSPSQFDGRVDAIDAVISRVFSRGNLIVPEQVAGNFPSLSAAIKSRGWPSLEATRGKIAFALFGTERHLQAYARNRPKLEGRMMFVVDEPGRPYTSIVMFDDPVRSQQRIERTVRQGYLVRTRADAELVRDARRRDAALSSGAHFIASDFVDPRYGWVDFGAVAPRYQSQGPTAAQSPAPVRCNPVSAPRTCGRTNLALIESERWASLFKPLTLP